MNKNNVMMRDEKGNWIVTDVITPNYENTETGHNNFIRSKKKEETNNLILTEVLPSNEGNVSFDNNFYSYVELTNVGEDDINLKDYYLSNNEKEIYRFRLEDKILKSNETYLVFTNKLDTTNNASFELKSKTGNVYLSNKNGIIDELEYNNLPKGVAYVKENN